MIAHRQDVDDEAVALESVRLHVEACLTCRGQGTGAWCAEAQTMARDLEKAVRENAEEAR